MVPDKVIKQWRQKGLTESIALLGKQIENGFSFSPSLPAGENLFWMGMGGSGLPAWIIASFWQTSLKKPLFIYQRSSLPAFIKNDDLVLVSSYSGNTRETGEFYNQAAEQGLNILGITAGGRLESRFEKNKTPFFKIDPRLNPSGQPRMGVGFGIGFLVKVLSRLNLLEKKRERSFFSALKNFDFRQSVDFKSDRLNTTASLFKDKICLIFAAPELAGLGRFYQNQINETAKQPAKLLVFPELDHYFLEGLSRLKELRSDFAVLILENGEETNQKKRTINLVAGWLKKRRLPTRRLKLPGQSPAEKLFWGLSFGQQLALSLSYLNNADPLKIAQVEWLKKEMEGKKS